MSVEELPPPRVADAAPAATQWPVRALCILLSVFQLAVIYVWALNPLLHFALFVAVVSGLIFLTDAEALSAESGPRGLRQWAAWLWAAVSLGAGAYFWARFDWIGMRWPLADPLGAVDLLVGAVFIVVVFEATRRTVGWVLVAVMAVFMGYAVFGHFAPGLFHHRPLSIPEVVDHLVFTRNGLFSAPVAIAATYVYVFVMFGTALELSGGGDFLFRLANSVTGRTRGGPAKVSIVSSGLYGMITGSPTANVMTTGLFTIPMMKRSGFRGDVAAGVESVAATGGALLPPVMGSAAFLMAELTGIPYLDIVYAGLIPALLFYLALFMQAHFRAVKLDLRPVTVDRTPPLTVLREGGYHLLPLLALIVLLAIGWPPMTAAGVALALTIVVSWIRPETRIDGRGLLTLLEMGARRSLLVTAACAAAGIVVGAIVTTGFAGKITSLIFAYASGSLIIALFATMVVCILLGMGMPVPSAYIVTAVLAGPPLVMLGLTTLSANLFILYFAVLSAITPPVAVAAYAAAGIADCDPTKAALQAVRLGIIAFVIPYFFVYRPELLLEGAPIAIAGAVLTSTVGVLLVAAALEGFVRVRVAPWERLLMFAAGFCLIFPGLATDSAGLVLGALAARRQLLSSGERPVAAADEPRPVAGVEEPRPVAGVEPGAGST